MSIFRRLRTPGHPGQAIHYPAPEGGVHNHADCVRLRNHVELRRQRDPVFREALLQSGSDETGMTRTMTSLQYGSIGLVVQALYLSGNQVALIVPGVDDLVVFPLRLEMFTDDEFASHTHEVDVECSLGVFLALAADNGPDAVYLISDRREEHL